MSSGTTISLARDYRGRLGPQRGAEQDAAKLGVVPGLRELGYRHAFRTLHGYASRSPRWTWETVAGHDGRWRVDQTFLSPDLFAPACQYRHQWREQGLSDHPALETDLEYSLG